MIDIDLLNEKQKEAVLTESKKIIVIAGAGAGKTKVLTTRIAYLLEKGAKAEEILALTFTNKASKEMKERIEKLTGINSKLINATTFHSFAVKVLRSFIEKLDIGFTKNFKIYDEDDTKKIMTKILEDNFISSKEYRNYLEIRRLLLSGKKVKSFYDPRVIDEFDMIALKNNSLTFDDLLIYMYKCFQISKILEYYQHKFRYILSDEFQDTDPLQYKILKMLQGYYGNLFVVGDDWQNIYSFRGATNDIVFQFLRDFPDYHMVKLEQNYRSTPEIIDMANYVIKKNTKQMDKTLFTKNSSGEVPNYFFINNYKDEAEFITKEIKRLVSNGYEYKDIAILYRNNSLSRNFEDSFIRNNMPYIIYNGTSFYQREEIKDIIAYLRIITDDFDNFALERIINKPRRKIGLKSYEALVKRAIDIYGNQKYSILNACKSSDIKQENEFYQKVIEIRGKYLKEHSSLKMSDLINYILVDLNYLDYVRTLKSSDTNDRYKNIDEFKTVVEEYERNGFYETLPNTLDFLNEFLQSISLYTNETPKGKDGEEKNQIKLMSVHASKGLEFRVVFLPALEETVFPNYRAEDESAIEEERRVFYVGVTRAKEKLFLSSAEERFSFGKVEYHNPSIFIGEARAKMKCN